MIFETVINNMKKIHEAKRTDYAGEDPFGNFAESEKIGIPMWKGVFVRLQDKYTRCVNLIARDGEHAVKDETLEDTLIDLANYAIIVLCLRDRTKTKETKCPEEKLCQCQEPKEKPKWKLERGLLQTSESACASPCSTEGSSSSRRTRRTGTSHAGPSKG